MSKWKYRDEGKRISKSVIEGKSKEDLIIAKTFLESLLELKKVEKLHSTYVKGVRKAVEYNHTNKIYTDFRLDGTVTGRLSCGMYKAEKPMGVSFHTLPRESKFNIRKFVIAPNEYDFITADHSTQEMRVMAHVSNETNMIDAFNRGVDLHTWTAQLLFEKEEPDKFERQIAKTVSFLIIYGGGAFNLAETMRIPIWRADEIIKKYQQLYPRVFAYINEVADFIKEHHYAESIFGRRRHLLDITSSNKQTQNTAIRQGVNFTVQSPASDTLLCAFVGGNNTIVKERLNALLVATVHDSIEAISHKSQTTRVVEAIRDEMVNYHYMRTTFGITLDVPLKVDIEVGRSFGTGVPYEDFINAL